MERTVYLGLYYIQYVEGNNTATYLSTTEDGKVIHSATPTAWGIRSDCGGIRYVHFCITIRRTNYSYRDDRIIIPYTDMNVELGDEPDENDSYNVLTSSIRSLMIWSYRSSFPKRPSTGSRFGRFNVSRVC